jgi:hypothetical protein
MTMVKFEPWRFLRDHDRFVFVVSINGLQALAAHPDKRPRWWHATAAMWASYECHYFHHGVEEFMRGEPTDES